MPPRKPMLAPPTPASTVEPPMRSPDVPATSMPAGAPAPLQIVGPGATSARGPSIDALRQAGAPDPAKVHERVAGDIGDWFNQAAADVKGMIQGRGEGNFST